MDFEIVSANMSDTPAGKDKGQRPQSPATPDQCQEAPKRPGDVEEGLPSTLPAGADDSALALMMPAQAPVKSDLLQSNTEIDEDVPDRPVFDDVPPQAASPDRAKVELEAEVLVLRESVKQLQLELQQQLDLFHQCLASERTISSFAVDQADTAACLLRDTNVQLTVELDILRARLAELETEVAKKHMASATDDIMEEGNAQLIAVLQVEIGDLERRLHRAQRSRAAAAEAEAAALDRADILAQQLEQMAALLEREREENDRMKAALQAAGVLPKASHC